MTEINENFRLDEYMTGIEAAPLFERPAESLVGPGRIFERAGVRVQRIGSRTTVYNLHDLIRLARQETTSHERAVLLEVRIIQLQMAVRQQRGGLWRGAYMTGAEACAALGGIERERLYQISDFRANGQRRPYGVILATVLIGRTHLWRRSTVAEQAARLAAAAAAPQMSAIGAKELA